MRLRGLLALIAVSLVGFVPVIVASPASASTSSDFVGDINGLRASKGLPALSVDGRLSSVAQDWANQMAAAGTISHRPSLGNSVSGNWTKLGENVGTGPDEGAIFNALVASAGHYRNMVEPAYTSIGVGVAVSADGRVFTAHDFAAYPGATSAPAASAPAASAPAASAPAAGSTPTTAARKAAVAKTAPTVKKQAPLTTTTTAAPAPAPEPAPEPVAAPVPPKPVPSQRITQGLAEIGSIAVQG